VQTQYSYEPFGKTTASGAANTSTFQYTDRENDGTGLYYFRARCYNPTLQRFISEDPIGLKGGDANFYVYTGDSPYELRRPLWSGQKAFLALPAGALQLRFYLQLIFGHPGNAGVSLI
jgi:RHS repeat-associated protein